MSRAIVILIFIYLLRIGIRNLLRRLMRNIKMDFCLTVRHQLVKVIQMNQLDATMIY